MVDAALVEAIRQALADTHIQGEGYRRDWARLRHAGLRTSKEQVRRLTRENVHLATSRTCRRRGPHYHDGTNIPETIDTMWGTDMAATHTLEHGQVAVFVAVDYASAEGVSIYALRGIRHEALESIRQGAAERFGGVEKDAAEGLAIRHDHDSQYISGDFQREIAWLGVTSSSAFVRAPEGNGCSEPSYQPQGGPRDRPDMAGFGSGKRLVGDRPVTSMVLRRVLIGLRNAAVTTARWLPDTRKNRESIE